MRDREIWRGVCGSRLTGVLSCSWRTGAAGGGPDRLLQELTTATASISIMKSGPARRVTPTVVLVGVATPR